ncbi:hypothetical protein [Streptomyces noursei]|uniref:Hydroxymethylcytosylglucuronate/cytosylglucurona te synthase n=1 Tax=Streptomyces noursei TaxID=1971 RepID=A0A2N8P7K0_STRNR|nr:hypothetical protein [Streptomyces noursei]PNE37003.1 hypothetical protein AOB60_21455 [Streptomyces noursei]
MTLRPPTADRCARVAVVATPFGFGPASKAYSIGQVLARHHGLDVAYYGTDSALDFFTAQHDTHAGPLGRRPPGQDPPELRSADAVVNVLAPELIGTGALAARTYYVDSLGFMWGAADVPPDSPLRRVRAYLAQDLFGSADHLARLGLRGVIPVSGIVAPPPAIPPPAPPEDTGTRTPDRTRVLVQLGGLGNPAGHTSGQVYLALVERLLTEVRHDAVEMNVAMNHAHGAFSLQADLPARQLSATEFRTALRHSDVVLSSPGMTTLVEVSQAARPYVPLPPQNWSQVLICRHLAAGCAHELWPFLTAPYDRIGDAAPEAEKAVAVQEINRRLGRDDTYVKRYAHLARHALGNPRTPHVGAPFDGAHEVAAVVAADLTARRSADEPTTETTAP